MATPISGLKTVTTAGTALALGTQIIAAPLLVKALTTNTGLMYVGNDGAGDVASTNGYPLLPGEEVLFEHVSSLASVFVDSAVNGEGVAWLIISA